jgi:PPK2 family polyphosphate:nucleotide phosphotransferase
MGAHIKTITQHFRVAQGERVDLKARPTRIDPVYASKRAYKSLLDEHVARLSAQQELLYASHRHAALIIFQAMDAAGKDGCIKHVISGVNPQGCEVISDSHPAPVELRHDFLWRTTCDLPERGKIAIFNRSYCEEVLIVRVHPGILQAEALADAPKGERIWHDRYRSIVDLECHLRSNGTRVVKFFLHVSKDEQRRRLLDRIDTREKNWKINAADLAEREYWCAYHAAYEDCPSATNTREAPWYVIPADDKMTARLSVSRIILETLEDLDVHFPAATPERQMELQAMRQQLEME